MVGSQGCMSVSARRTAVVMGCARHRRRPSTTCHSPCCVESNSVVSRPPNGWLTDTYRSWSAAASVAHRVPDVRVDIKSSEPHGLVTIGQVFRTARSVST